MEENKKNLDSLTDINRSIHDMLERQSQLKRNNFELETENKDLLNNKEKIRKEISLMK
jgi:hypothetical protein